VKQLIYIPTDEEKELAVSVATQTIDFITKKLSTETQKELIAFMIKELLMSFEDASGYDIAQSIIDERKHD
jgi:hypothetical protein